MAPDVSALFTLTAHDRSAIPSPDSDEYAAWVDAMVAEGERINASVDGWNASGTKHGMVEMARRPLKHGEHTAWASRTSYHADHSYEQFRDGLLKDHAPNEKAFIPMLANVERLQTFREGELEIWQNRYNMSFPNTNRDFVELILCRETSTEPGRRAFIVISTPIHEPKLKGHVRGLYVSVETVREMEHDGKTQLQWRTATCSNPGGYVPIKIVDQVLPSKIADDVPHFLHFIDSRPKPAAGTPSTPAPADDRPTAAAERPQSPSHQSTFASLRNKLSGRRHSKDSSTSV